MSEEQQSRGPHREPQADVGVLLHQLHELGSIAGVVQEGAAILHMHALHSQHPCEPMSSGILSWIGVSKTLECSCKTVLNLPHAELAMFLAV